MNGIEPILILALIGLLSPVFVMCMKMLSAPARPGRVLIEQVPKFQERRYFEFTLFMGHEKKSGKAFLLPASTLVGHMLMLAPTRRGKSTMLEGYIEQFIKAGFPLVAFDAQKSETEGIYSIAKKYGREQDIVTLPDAGYNMLRSGTSPTERAINFAEVFAQVSGLGAGEAAFWLQYAQLYIQTVIPYFEVVTGQNMILDELIDLLTNDRARKQLEKQARLSEERYNFEAHFKNWSQDKYEKTLSGLVLFLRRIADPDIKNMYNVRNAPTIEELIEQRKIIIIREGGTRTNLYARARGLSFMLALQKYIEGRRGKEYLPIILDEAHMYFNNAFQDYMATCGKRNVGNILAFQNFSQAQEMMNTIISNCNTWLILNGLLYTDAKIVADQIGYRPFNISSVAHSGDQNRIQESMQYDYLYQAYQIQNLKADEAMILTTINRENEPPRIIKRPERSIFQKVQIPPLFISPDKSIFRL